MKTKLLILSSFLLLFVFLVSTKADAATKVKGYVKGNGTYVKPHYKTPANNTKPNINSFTGKKGTVNPLRTTKKK